MDEETAEALTRTKALYDAGVLTEEEYSSKKIVQEKRVAPRASRRRRATAGQRTRRRRPGPRRRRATAENPPGASISRRHPRHLRFERGGVSRGHADTGGSAAICGFEGLPAAARRDVRHEFARMVARPWNRSLRHRRPGRSRPCAARRPLVFPARGTRAQPTQDDQPVRNSYIPRYVLLSRQVLQSRARLKKKYVQDKGRRL